jgi:hypothetical protein|nr:MAG TPA: hypothetical protein [Caudoviricetes sp.]
MKLLKVEYLEESSTAIFFNFGVRQKYIQKEHI